MATANTHNNNSLTFTLVWYDANAYSEKNKPIRDELEKVFGDLMAFPEEEQCNRFIENRFQPKTVVLIISGQLGETYVKKIHDKENVSSIFVFCEWKAKHEIWTKEFKKVKYFIHCLCYS
jgi:hypothetical protein